MKTKAKLTLALSVLSAAVLAAGVTSTFAWFTTQSKATLSTGVMTVSTVSDISITVTKLGYDVGTATSDKGFGVAGTEVEDSGVSLGVVSSTNGVDFFAPVALSDDANDYDGTEIAMGTVTKKTEWETAHTNRHVGFVKYGIHVHAAADVGSSRTLKYQITATPSDTTNLAAAYRVALWTATYSSSTFTKSTKLGIWSNSKIEGASGWSSTTSKGTYDVEKIADVNTPQATTTTTASEINDYYIFSVWVEGEDTHATNTLISADTLKVDLEFSLA